MDYESIEDVKSKLFIEKERNIKKNNEKAAEKMNVISAIRQARSLTPGSEY